MKNLEIAACAAFGVESVTKRELAKLGIADCPAVDGRLIFRGDMADVIDCNINLRTADRVLIKAAEFRAETFDDLFDGVYSVNWRDFASADQKIAVAVKSVKSKLSALGAVRGVAKKAVAEKLKKSYGLTGNLDESGSVMKIEVSLKNDVAALWLDTSGAGLHKRGYRALVGVAPLRETLAAAVIMLSVWNPDRVFADLFCGSGTLPIEAAMIGLNMAPGMNRTFDMCGWKFFDRRVFDDAVEKARAAVTPRELRVYGFDIDENAVSLARKHAERCGVEKHIHFQRQDFRDFSSKQRYGVIVSNPPYGERLMSQREVRGLYRDLGEKFFSLKAWSCGIITSYYAFESAFGKKADKNRKFFNSNIECRFFQYLGAKPPEKHQ